MLSKIPGVFSANVSEDELGDIAEIHILASTRRNAKQISRDVQSAIAAAFHREVDHRTISIAQIDSAAYGGVDDRRMRQEARLRYVGMNVSMRDGPPRLSGAPDARGHGLYRRGVLPQFARTRSGAPWPRPRFALWRAPFPWMGSCRWWRSTMRTWPAYPSSSAPSSAPRRRDGRLLIGAAHYMRDDDEAECVVRATLDALNRFCGRLAVRD